LNFEKNLNIILALRRLAAWPCLTNLTIMSHLFKVRSSDFPIAAIASRFLKHLKAPCYFKVPNNSNVCPLLSADQHLCGSPSPTWLDISVSASVRACGICGEVAVPNFRSHRAPPVEMFGNNAQHRWPHIWIFILAATQQLSRIPTAAARRGNLHCHGDHGHVVRCCRTHGSHCPRSFCSHFLSSFINDSSSFHLPLGNSKTTSYTLILLW
jgi:hypothetical protein